MTTTPSWPVSRLVVFDGDPEQLCKLSGMDQIRRVDGTARSTADPLILDRT
jgi:hypothetical protein